MQELEHKGQKIVVFGKNDVSYYLFSGMNPDDDIIEYKAKSIEEAQDAIDKAISCDDKN